MRDIPGFGVWLAIMTVMSGVVACGPDKPAVSGPGARPAGGDAATIGAGDAATTRPPPVQAGDSGAERPPPTMTTGAATGCTPAAADAGADARDATADSSMASDVGPPASGGRSGTGGGAGGGADGTGGRVVAPGPDAGAGGTGVDAGNTGGAPASAGGAAATGGRPPATGGTPGSGGAPASGGAPMPGSGGAGATGGSVGGFGGAAGSMSTGAAPAPGELAIVELLINPASTDTGREWLELLNRTTHAISLTGLHVADAANDAAVDFGSGPALLPAGARAVLVQSVDPAKNGGIAATTAAVVGIFGTLVSLNNDADTISICGGSCTAGGVVIDKVAWDATLGTGYDGHALVIDGSKRCPATAAFGDAGSFGTPGATNEVCP